LEELDRARHPVCEFPRKDCGGHTPKLRENFRAAPQPNSTPVDLQLVFDSLYAIQAAEHFLGHLFLVKGTDGTGKSDKPISCLNVDPIGREVGTAADRTVNLGEEGAS